MTGRRLPLKDQFTSQMKFEGSQNSMCIDGALPEAIAESERNLEDSPRNFSPARI